MSTFICTECGARFDGPLTEASNAAFAHTAEHAQPAQKLALEAARMMPPENNLLTAFSPICERIRSGCLWARR